MQGHSDAITSLCYVASDRLLCSSSMDLTIRLWDLSSGHQQRCFAGGHMRSINSIGPSFHEQVSVCVETGSQRSRQQHEC